MRALVRRFLELESSSSIILFMMAITAIIWTNSPIAYLHEQFVSTFLFIINDGLMAIFFLVVGLELKRGFLDGQLSTLRQVTLPFAAAVGGMLIPALLYVLVNWGNAQTIQGWATPVATDIAFAVGVLSLFSRQVPSGLKLFLLALAIFDDIGAILIIALFFSKGVSLLLLLQAAVLVMLLFFLNRNGVKSLIPYLMVGVLLWLTLLFSGIHPTITGVLLALTIPDAKKDSPLYRLEDGLHPWVAYLIMPLFALANAGFSFQGMTFNIFDNTVVLGIIVGLFFGKQLGVLGFSWLIIKAGVAKIPENTGWMEIYGVSLLCGIGFTMSLFLGTLSFQHETMYLTAVRYGVLVGSAFSGLIGALVLYIAFSGKKRRVLRD